MSLWEKLRGELVDIIEWQTGDRDLMVWRFPRYDNAIKNGAKLIVRESQMAAVISEGMLTDLFNNPGTYTLTTQNLPILSTLKGWKYGFESPFKVDVYFVSLRTFTDRKWGTKNPIMLRDPEFGPVRLRAFGNFSIKVSDPATLLKNVVGTDGRFTIDEIGDQLRDMLVSRFATVVAEAKIPVLDLAANYEQLGKFIWEKIEPDFEQFGLRVVTLHIENISLPPEVEQAMDKRTSMGIIGDLNKYTQFQVGTSLEAAAKNPAGSGPVMMGVGMTMANQAIGQMQQPPAAVPPPLPQVNNYHVVLNGQQAGPFDVMKFPALIAAGQINPQTLVWKPGMPNWTPAGNVTELAALFQSNTPPPIP
jgi:membrane protease subunit (stomatin/prohibitin family)